MSKMGDRVRVIRDNYRQTKQLDPQIGKILLGILVLVALVTAGLMVWTGNPLTWLIIGLSVLILVEAFVFSRRAMSAAYKSIEGKPGAAVAIIGNENGKLAKSGWGATPAVAVNKSQDLVHRAVGTAGVVLLGEGSQPALGTLMASERKRITRFIGEMPITEIVVGSEEGQVPVARLEKHLAKLPKVLSPAEARELRKKLDALAANPLPMPKGPMPKSGRMPRGGKLR